LLAWLGEWGGVIKGRVVYILSMLWRAWAWRISTSVGGIVGSVVEGGSTRGLGNGVMRLEMEI
jgi:hypothetical protein